MLHQFLTILLATLCSFQLAQAQDPPEFKFAMSYSNRGSCTYTLTRTQLQQQLCIGYSDLAIKDENNEFSSSRIITAPSNRKHRIYVLSETELKLPTCDAYSIENDIRYSCSGTVQTMTLKFSVSSSYPSCSLLLTYFDGWTFNKIRSASPQIKLQKENLFQSYTGGVYKFLKTCTQMDNIQFTTLTGTLDNEIANVELDADEPLYAVTYYITFPNEKALIPLQYYNFQFLYCPGTISVVLKTTSWSLRFPRYYATYQEADVVSKFLTLPSSITSENCLYSNLVRRDNGQIQYFSGNSSTISPSNLLYLYLNFEEDTYDYHIKFYYGEDILVSSLPVQVEMIDCRTRPLQIQARDGLVVLGKEEAGATFEMSYFLNWTASEPECLPYYYTLRSQTVANQTKSYGLEDTKEVTSEGFSIPLISSEALNTFEISLRQRAITTIQYTYEFEVRTCLDTSLSWTSEAGPWGTKEAPLILLKEEKPLEINLFNYLKIEVGDLEMENDPCSEIQIEVCGDESCTSSASLEDGLFAFDLSVSAELKAKWFRFSTKSGFVMTKAFWLGVCPYSKLEAEAVQIQAKQEDLGFVISKADLHLGFNTDPNHPQCRLETLEIAYDQTFQEDLQKAAILLEDNTLSVLTTKLNRRFPKSLNITLTGTTVRGDSAVLPIDLDLSELNFTSSFKIDWSLFNASLEINETNTTNSTKETRSDPQSPPPPAFIPVFLPEDVDEPLPTFEDIFTVHKAKITSVSHFGEVKITLTGSPSEFKLAITSKVDGSEYWADKSSSRRLSGGTDEGQSELKNCQLLIGCEAESKEFKWTILSRSNSLMLIELGFFAKASISTSVYGGDVLTLYSYDDEGMLVDKSSFLIPPQMQSRAQAQAIESGAQVIGDSISVFTSSNLLIAIFLGGTLGQLFGMLRLIQLVMLSAVVQVTYPAQLDLFYHYCVVFSELDILQGPFWYDQVFAFRETKPFNLTFNKYSISSLNFFSNSGSLALLLAITVVSFTAATVLKSAAKKGYKIQFWREIGMASEQYLTLRAPLLRMAVECYLDIALSAMLGTFAILKSDPTEVGEVWFGTWSDGICSTLTLGSLALIFYLPYYAHTQIQSQFKVLENPDINEHCQPFIEDYKLLNRNQAGFTSALMLRRFVLSFALIEYSCVPGLQIKIFMGLSLASLAWLIHVKPYKDQSIQLIELVNEAVVLFQCHIHHSLLIATEKESTRQEYAGLAGWAMLGAVAIALLLNLGLVGHDQVSSLLIQVQQYKQRKQRKLQQERLSQAHANITKQYGQLASLKEVKEFQRAHQFCREFNLERKWCASNGLDYRFLPQEQQFQEYLLKFNFRKLRELEVKENLVKSKLADRFSRMNRREKHMRVNQRISDRNLNTFISAEEEKPVNKEAVEGIWKTIASPEGEPKVVFIKRKSVKTRRLSTISSKIGSLFADKQSLGPIQEESSENSSQETQEESPATSLSYLNSAIPIPVKSRKHLLSTLKTKVQILEAGEEADINETLSTTAKEKIDFYAQRRRSTALDLANLSQISASPIKQSKKPGVNRRRSQMRQSVTVTQEAIEQMHQATQLEIQRHSSLLHQPALSASRMSAVEEQMNEFDFAEDYIQNTEEKEELAKSEYSSSVSSASSVRDIEWKQSEPVIATLTASAPPKLQKDPYQIERQKIQESLMQSPALNSPLDPKALLTFNLVATILSQASPTGFTHMLKEQGSALEKQLCTSRPSEEVLKTLEGHPFTRGMLKLFRQVRCSFSGDTIYDEAQFKTEAKSYCPRCGEVLLEKKTHSWIEVEEGDADSISEYALNLPPPKEAGTPCPSCDSILEASTRISQTSRLLIVKLAKFRKKKPQKRKSGRLSISPLKKQVRKGRSIASLPGSGLSSPATSSRASLEEVVSITLECDGDYPLSSLSRQNTPELKQFDLICGVWLDNGVAVRQTLHGSRQWVGDFKEDTLPLIAIYKARN